MAVVQHNLADTHAAGLVLLDCEDTVLYSDPLASVLNLGIHIRDRVRIVTDPVVELLCVNSLGDLGGLARRDIRNLKSIAVGGCLDVRDEVGVGVLSADRPNRDVSRRCAFHRVYSGRNGD